MKEKPILFTTYVYLPTIIYNLSMYHYLITIHTWNYLEHGLKFDRRVNIYPPSINLGTVLLGSSEDVISSDFIYFCTKDKKASIYEACS